MPGRTGKDGKCRRRWKSVTGIFASSMTLSDELLLRPWCWTKIWKGSIMKRSACLLVILPIALCMNASAQNLEFGTGFAHISGDQGLDGFNLGAAIFFTHRISMAFDYDSGWDSSHLGTFELTQAGTVITKSHLQNYLAGPRIFFPVLKSSKINIPRLWPFVEVQLGASHLKSTLEEPARNVSQGNSDNAFTWMLGGGVDYQFSPHWGGRVKVDLERTHFADTGQSRVRLVLGVAYTIKERSDR